MTAKRSWRGLLFLVLAAGLLRAEAGAQQFGQKIKVRLSPNSTYQCTLSGEVCRKYDVLSCEAKPKLEPGLTFELTFKFSDEEEEPKQVLIHLVETELEDSSQPVSEETEPVYGPERTASSPPPARFPWVEDVEVGGWRVRKVPKTDWEYEHEKKWRKVVCQPEGKVFRLEVILPGEEESVSYSRKFQLLPAD